MCVPEYMHEDEMCADVCRHLQISLQGISYLELVFQVVISCCICAGNQNQVPKKVNSCS